MSRILPILFNTDMVQAILDGRKTETRRLVKKPYFVCDNGNCAVTMRTAPKSSNLFVQIGHMPYQENPYRIGDILYARETWSFQCCIECINQLENESCMDGKVSTIYEDKDAESEGCYIYRADHPHPERITWRPSIHMPKDAARIWLKVTDVRAERLQAMGHDGPTKEGIHFCNCPDGFTWKPNTDMFNCYTDPMGAMRALWDSTIKKPDLPICSWDANPWVWVIEFERCKKPEIPYQKPEILSQSDSADSVTCRNFIMGRFMGIK